MQEQLRILYICPETAGDILLSTGVIDGIKDQFPNSKIYFACKKEFFGILKGNPLIAGVIEFDPSMDNYRNYETWGPQQGVFDITFKPYIRTQRIPEWIRNGHGPWLGDAYANICDVEYGEQFLASDDSLLEQHNDFFNDEEFITIHAQSRQDPKDYDHIQDVVDRIEGIKKVQIGGPSDMKLDGIDLDLRGQTSPQQLKSVLMQAKMHFGLDSFPMHVAMHVDTPSVILFGGTYAKQGVNPRKKDIVRAIETKDRGLCVTSCHLIKCQQKEQGNHDKCINNISVDEILQNIGDFIGKDKIKPPTPLNVSAYMIIRDGIKYGFPFEESIRAASKICDEVVVVDGGSTDGTFDKLEHIRNALAFQSDKPHNVKVLKHDWDLDNPTLFGDEKTYARQQCTGDWLIQLDADEIISEPAPGLIKDLIRRNKKHELLAMPCINFYSDDSSVRIEDNCWKWRISKNDPNIIHGVHGPARKFDPESMKITMDKNVSDGCEYIYKDSLEVIKPTIIFPHSYLVSHEMLKRAKQEDFGKAEEFFNQQLESLVKMVPVVYHYSWHDLKRKEENGEFWNQTFHGKKKETHNTTEDISKRVQEAKDLIVNVKIDHPLKKVEA